MPPKRKPSLDKSNVAELQAQEYKEGDYIFAKVRGYPWWPGFVCKFAEDKAKYRIWFYETEQESFMKKTCLLPYNESTRKFVENENIDKKSKRYSEELKRAFEQIEEEAVAKSVKEDIKITQMLESSSVMKLVKEDVKITQKPESSSVVKSAKEDIKTTHKPKSSAVAKSVKEDIKTTQKPKSSAVAKSVKEDIKTTHKPKSSAVAKSVKDLEITEKTKLPGLTIKQLKSRLLCPIAKMFTDNVVLGIIGHGERALEIIRILNAPYTPCYDMVLTESPLLELAEADYENLDYEKMNSVAELVSRSHIIIALTLNPFDVHEFIQCGFDKIGSGKAFVDMSNLDIDSTYIMSGIMEKNGACYLEMRFNEPLKRLYISGCFHERNKMSGIFRRMACYGGPEFEEWTGNWVGGATKRLDDMLSVKRA